MAAGAHRTFVRGGERKQHAPSSWSSGRPDQECNVRCPLPCSPDITFGERLASEEIGNRFRVTLWLEQVGATALDKTEQAIPATLSDGTGRVTSEVAKAIGLTPRATPSMLDHPSQTGPGESTVIPHDGPRSPQPKALLAALLI